MGPPVSLIFLLFLTYRQLGKPKKLRSILDTDSPHGQCDELRVEPHQDREQIWELWEVACQCTWYQAQKLEDICPWGIHSPRFPLTGGRAQSTPSGCLARVPLLWLSPLSFGSCSRAEKPEEILNYYHVVEKTGALKSGCLIWIWTS